MMTRYRIASFAVAFLASSVCAQMPGDSPMLPPGAAPANDMPATAGAAAASLMGGAAPIGSLPSVTDAATEEVVTDTPTLPLAPVFSYGNVENSLLFTSVQIRNMKQSLKAYESIRRDAMPLAPEEEIFTMEAPVEVPTINEPTTYPVFFLSSIVYKNSSDWAVWINGSRITPRTNKGEVRVMSVRPDRAWFSWSPEYLPAVIDRVAQKNFANSDAVKHRMSRKNTAAYDRQSNSIQFSLRPNQSFAPGYFEVFEGKINAPIMQTTAAGADGEAAPMSPEAAQAINGLLGDSSAPVSSERSLMDQMIENQTMTPNALPQPTAP